ncbi:MAG: helix-turn-helix transcriptional regulator [Lachnospiraceae bacterium]|nr:helix-turn-helix transcriptional regulator [Lachnospiraceae bacterium]MCI9098343.1 helix-turn-helix transcriptional regulator [Lachnospiraceae bacterium]MCI9356761.1 helix-turn-helix transcriptional regulator [Lachnospiraceae bacterium]
MKVCYDKLWKLLIDKKMKKTDLIRDAKISSNVLAKMGKEESVSLESIGKICSLFGCSVDDILEFKLPEQTADNGENK